MFESFSQNLYLNRTKKFSLVQTGFLGLTIIILLTNCSKEINKNTDVKGLLKSIEVYSKNDVLTGKTVFFYNSKKNETLRVVYKIDPINQREEPSSKMETRFSNDTLYQLYYIYKTNISDYVLNSVSAYLYDPSGYTQTRLGLTSTSPDFLPILTSTKYKRTVSGTDIVYYTHENPSYRDYKVDKMRKTVTWIHDNQTAVNNNQTTFYYECFDGANFDKLPLLCNHLKEFNKGLCVVYREVYEDLDNPSNNSTKNSTLSKDTEGKLVEVILPNGTKNKYIYY